VSRIGVTDQLELSCACRNAHRLTPFREDGCFNDDADHKRFDAISLGPRDDTPPTDSLSSGHQSRKPRTPRVAIRLRPTYLAAGSTRPLDPDDTHVKDEFESVGSLGVVLRSKVEVFPAKQARRRLASSYQTVNIGWTVRKPTSSRHKYHHPNRTAKAHRSSLRPCNTRSRCSR
jgi:hypothetical protein